ncbi:hypothetical protein KHO61_gp010 [Mycobacterium phage Mangeria]|uniref:Uncharacterized protein n=1 Tax=Mycobacterium phage Mangeria TaxID=2686471 RepID=A0A6B9LPA2_9CAUD|nr:hypothetical protein KHO61_gp010 [Mycobacterium phage Mangeria]QHB47580.1 hypothetical protein SEA_MANGERIA_10 [Mycobacterium phage Mangeria]
MRLLCWARLKDRAERVTLRPVMDASTGPGDGVIPTGGPYFEQRDGRWELSWHLRGAMVTFQLDDYEARYLHAQMGEALNAKEQP